MLSESELADLLVGWKIEHGEDIRGRMCVPIDRPLRIAMFQNLIHTLIELHGYTKEDFEGNTYRRVMEASINPNSEKKDKWREAATSDWREALNSFFPPKVLVYTPEEKKTEYKRPVSGKSSPIIETLPEIPPEELLDTSKLETGIPAPQFVVDEEFLKMLKGESDE